jgi:hypothetical protein
MSGAAVPIGRSDAVLLAIPLSFLLLGATAIALGFAVEVALALAAVPSGLLVADSLFLNPPVESGPP